MMTSECGSRLGELRTPLHNAAIDGNITIVRMVLNDHSDIKNCIFAKDRWNNTALKLAVDHGHDQVVALLLDACPMEFRADLINCKDIHGRSPICPKLYEVADEKILKILLAHCATDEVKIALLSESRPHAYYRMPVQVANLNQLKIMLDSLSSDQSRRDLIDKADEVGFTALSIATDCEIIKILFSLYPDASSQFAYIQRHFVVHRALYSNGQNKLPAVLDIIFKLLTEEMIKSVLSEGYAPQGQGDTLLHTNPFAAKVLLSYLTTEQAKLSVLSAKNNLGRTPLHFSRTFENLTFHTNTILNNLTKTENKLLLLKEKDLMGDTPIHSALTLGYRSIRFLLETVFQHIPNERDKLELLTTKNNAGISPLKWVIHHNHVDLLFIMKSLPNNLALLNRLFHEEKPDLQKQENQLIDWKLRLFSVINGYESKFRFFRTQPAKQRIASCKRLKEVIYGFNNVSELKNEINSIIVEIDQNHQQHATLKRVNPYLSMLGAETASSLSSELKEVIKLAPR